MKRTKIISTKQENIKDMIMQYLTDTYNPIKFITTFKNNTWTIYADCSDCTLSDIIFNASALKDNLIW